MIERELREISQSFYDILNKGNFNSGLIYRQELGYIVVCDCV